MESSPVLASGVGLYSDELEIVAQYRRIREDGWGQMFLEFRDHRVTKFDVKIGGRVDLLNGLLPKR